MLHWWLLPLLVLAVLVLWAFYLVLKARGGTGVRTEGHTVVDEPDDQDLPEQGYKE